MDNKEFIDVGDVLDAAVRKATGNPEAQGRPGQVRLTLAIDEALQNCGHHIGEAGTGVGKSLAYLVPAALAAAENGTRSIISTESLSLQSQLVTKDAPVVAETIKELTGKEIKVAAYKGWGNYVCALAAQKNVAEHLGRPGPLNEATAEKLDSVGGDGAELLAWGIRQLEDDTALGDKADAPTTETWHDISTSADACAGIDTCPFAEICKPQAAKVRASESDIMVTNHTLLAIQAANHISVVVGNKTLGPFKNLIVDEAHALPSQVRNQGSSAISPERIVRLAKSIGRLGKEGREMEADGLNIAALVEKTVDKLQVNGKQRKIEENENPVVSFQVETLDWLKKVSKYVGTKSKADPNDLRLRRLKVRVEKLRLELFDIAQHIPGVARWVEDGEIKSSPVQVSGRISELYETDEEQEPKDYGPLSVVMVSATLPNEFHREVGMTTPSAFYESPFHAAYGGSALYVPTAVSSEDIEALKSDWGGPGKLRFDTFRHSKWAARKINDLVDASGGRALILSAKAEDGRYYANRLRKTLPKTIKVFDQWTSPSSAMAVKQWREDETSVLVGTRSLMTGTDAPGDTCQLVVIDRIPRSPSNPVDDARVEAIRAGTNIDKWTADAMVYVADAALLVKQSSGRLIRSITDRGLVACLDPRLLKAVGSAFNYPERTRKTYLNALGPYGYRFTNMDEVRAYFEWLQENGGE